MRSLDISILVAYLGLLWGVGLWISFRHRKHDGDFMINRHYSWFNIGSSIFATNIGPSFLVIWASAAFAAGMAAANYEWLAWMFLLLLGMVCAPYYIRMRITTMPEFIRRRFGPQAADFLSIYGLFTVIVVWIGGDLFVGGKFLHQLMGYPEWMCVVALAFVFMTFTVAGGFSAVMVTDTAQAIMMIVSMVILNVIAFNHIGSVDNLLHSVPGEFWQLLRPADDVKYPWVAIILGYPVLGFWYWCTDQTIVQRMLGARDLKQAQYGAVYTAVLKILPPFLFMMPGIFCIALRPGIEKPDDAFYTMLQNYMPMGMMGLMIAVLFAASVAGVAGGLNAFSTIFAMDIYKGKLRPGASDHQLKRVGQLSIVIVSIAAVGVALLLQQSKSTIFDTLQSIIGFFAPPVTTVFLFSLLWKRATTKGVLATLYAGTAISLTVGALKLAGKLPASPWTHFMFLSFLLFVVCVAILVGVSLLTEHSEFEQPLEKASADTMADVPPAGEGAGKKVWVMWGVLAVVMVGLYVGFQSTAIKRQSAEIYLSPEGSDEGTGRAAKPFRTVERARAEIAKMEAEGRLPDGGMNVWIHHGKAPYAGAAPDFSKPEETSVPGKPIRWRAFPGEKPVFTP